MAIKKCNPNSQVYYAANKPANSNKTKETNLFNETKSVNTQNEMIVSETENIIKELFEPICKKFYLEYDKEYVLSLIKKINSSYSEESDTETLKRVALCIEKAFEEHYDKKANQLDLDKSIETASIYDASISSGQSTENLKKNSQKNIASIVSEQYGKTHKGEKVNFNALSADEKKKYIKDYFESKLNEYLSNPNTKDNAYKVLLTDFMILTKNTPDSEKNLLLKTAMEVFKSADAVSYLFQNFKNDALKTECADSLDFEYVKETNSIEKAEIVSNNASKTKLVQYLKEFNEKFRIFYEENKEVIDRLCNDEKPQNENEEKIQKELYKYLNVSAGLTIGASYNKNLSKEEQKEYVKNINDTVKKYPIYNKYIESLAEYVFQHQNSQDITVDKLKELLNEITDNKFSEILNNISEKSAINKETGMLKIADNETIAQSKEKIQEIKEKLYESSTTENYITDRNNRREEMLNTAVNYETIMEDDGVKLIKDILSGKVRVSEYLEQVAIKQYKLMNTAMQGNILLNATGEFFNDLVENLETSTFEHLLNIGWKGRSYAATKQVKDEFEERKNDVA